MVHLNSRCMLGQAYARSHARGKNFNPLEPENDAWGEEPLFEYLMSPYQRGVSLEVKAGAQIHYKWHFSYCFLFISEAED